MKNKSLDMERLGNELVLLSIEENEKITAGFHFDPVKFAACVVVLTLCGIAVGLSKAAVAKWDWGKNGYSAQCYPDLASAKLKEISYKSDALKYGGIGFLVGCLTYARTIPYEGSKQRS